MSESINPFQAPVTAESAVADQSSAGPLLFGDDLIRMERVGKGLGMIYAAIVLELACSLSAGLAGVLMPLLIKTDAARGYVLIGFELVMVSAALLTMVGAAFCVVVPHGARAAPLVIAAMGLAVLSIGVLVAAGLLPKVFGLKQLGGACLFAAAVSFFWFLRRVATFIGERRYARRAVYILVVMLVLYAWGLANQLGSRLPEISVGLMALISLGTFLSYANLITYLRKAVRRCTSGA